jgi:plastocyanin
MVTRLCSGTRLRAVLVAALVVAALPGVTVERTHAKEPFGLPAAELYVADSPVATMLSPLDAATLELRPERQGVDIESFGQESLPVLSENGSTLVAHGNDGTIVVRDGLFGPERLRFFPNGTVGNLKLSRDGRRLVAEAIVDYSAENLHPPAWKVFDTADGRLLATVENRESGDLWEEWAVDADAHRLYRLVSMDASTGPNQIAVPSPTQLIAHDLTTGAEVGRLDLPEVLAGFWQSAETVAIGDGEEPLMKQLLPALAISPDGRSLAIVHADDDILTLVDTERLTVERTDALVRPVSAWNRLFSLLPFVPHSASAKALEGTMLEAVFAPDGQHLYVFGMRASVEDGEPIVRGLGLRGVDVSSGEVDAVAFGEAIIDRVLPSSDGGSLYVAGPAADVELAGGNYFIRRVDAHTLDVLAEQSYPSGGLFLVRSTLADPTVPLTVEMVEMAVVPEVISVPADTPVRLTVVNHGTVRHSFRAGDEGGGTWDVRVELVPGDSETVLIDAPAGEYKMICDLAEHATMGMGGAIVAR